MSSRVRPCSPSQSSKEFCHVIFNPLPSSLRHQLPMAPVHTNSQSSVQAFDQSSQSLTMSHTNIPYKYARWCCLPVAHICADCEGKHKTKRRASSSKVFAIPWNARINANLQNHCFWLQTSTGFMLKSGEPVWAVSPSAIRHHASRVSWM